MHINMSNRVLRFKAQLAESQGAACPPRHPSASQDLQVRRKLRHAPVAAGWMPAARRARAPVAVHVCSLSLAICTTVAVRVRCLSLIICTTGAAHLCGGVCHVLNAVGGRALGLLLLLLLLVEWQRRGGPLRLLRALLLLLRGAG